MRDDSNNGCEGDYQIIDHLISLDSFGSQLVKAKCVRNYCVTVEESEGI